VINKSRLHKEALTVIRNEAQILKKLVGKAHIVQVKNVSES